MTTSEAFNVFLDNLNSAEQNLIRNPSSWETSFSKHLETSDFSPNLMLLKYFLRLNLSHHGRVFQIGIWKPCRIYLG